MRFYYCPRCKKEILSDNELFKDRFIGLNLRDGWGRPIKHYECECGCKSAGSILTIGWDLEKDDIEYMKHVIRLYYKED